MSLGFCESTHREVGWESERLLKVRLESGWKTGCFLQAPKKGRMGMVFLVQEKMSATVVRARRACRFSAMYKITCRLLESSHCNVNFLTTATLAFGAE